MDFYQKHNLDFRKFRVVLSCWRCESSWRILINGFPSLQRPKSKLELRFLFSENAADLEKHILICESNGKKLRIKVDEYECDWLDKGISLAKKRRYSNKINADLPIDYCLITRTDNPNKHK